MMIVEIAMLWDISGHPVARPLEHEKVEDSVVNGSAAFGFLAQIQIPEALGEFDDQNRFSRVIVEPRF